MSAYSDSMLEAMKTLSEKAVSNKASTLTIECTIKAINDIGLGIYTVDYLNNTFKVFSSDNTRVYEIGDKVCVLVQNGDFSKDKYIISVVDRTSNAYTNAEEVDRHYEISDNLIKLVDDMSVIELSTYSSDYVSSELLPSNQLSLKELLNYYFYDENYDYDTLKFVCNIKTDIAKDQQTVGNYGLNLKIPIQKLNTETNEWEEDYKETILDINNILGNPYNLSIWTPQELYIILDKQYERLDTSTRNLSLTAFVKDFKTGAFVPDIWIKDIQLCVADEFSENELSGYYLSIVCDSGPFFTTNTSELNKTLKPLLRINGKETSVKNHQCYWFIEDTSITRESNYFCSYGGIGWKCLNERVETGENEDGGKSYDFKSDLYELVVNKDDVITSSRYKCVVTFNEVKLTGYLVITNCDSGYTVSLYPEQDSYSIIKNIGSKNIICKVFSENEIDLTTDNLVYSWSRYDKNGNYIDSNFYDLIRNNDDINNDKHTFETEINIKADKVDTLNTIYCTVYKEYVSDNQIFKKLLGTKSITIFVEENNDYQISIQNANVLYKYDSDGDSPLSADYDGPISSRITSTVPIGFRVFKPGGIELTDEEYLSCQVTWKVPINSMIKLQNISFLTEGDYYIVTGTGQSTLSYTIDSSFNKNKDDNTIILNIDFDNKTLEQAATILFVKEGESGTNGTKYTAVIYYQNGGEWFSLGSKDAKGYYRDLKMIYHPLSNYSNNNEEINTAQWVFIDGQPLDEFSTAYFYKKLGEYHPTFDVKIFKDGQEIIKGTTEYNELVQSVTYQWFDGGDNESLDNKTCFLIENNTIAGSKAPWVNKEDIYCNILQVKIALNTSSDNFSAEYIYAYYPIEITLISRENTPFLYGQYDVLDRVPFIRNGFYNVLYASDGTNPKYDTSSNFYCSEGKEEAYYRNYIWSSNEDIKLKPIDVEIEENIRQKECKGTPNSSWRGETCNYVKVVSEQDNENYSYSIITDKIMHLDCQIQELEWEKDLIVQEKNDFDTILEKYLQQTVFQDCKYKIINEYFENAIPYLNERYSCYTLLNKIINKMNDYIDFYSSNDPVMPKYYLDELKNRLAIYLIVKNNYLLRSYNSLIISLIDETTIKNISSHYQYPNLVINDLNTLNNYIIEYNEKAQDFIDDQTNLQSSLYNYNKIFNYFNSLYTEINSKVKTETQTFTSREVDLFNESKQVTLSGTYQTQKEWFSIKDKLNALKTNIFKEIVSYDEIKAFLINQLDTYFDPFIKDNILISYFDTYYDNILRNIDNQINDCNNQINNLRWLAWQCFYTYTTIRPIVCIINRYEMSNINAWDGARLYAEDEYLLAPQVGAGYKNPNNTFTGIVIGKKILTENNQRKVKAGLYGYHEGEMAIELDADTGSATFGLAKSNLQGEGVIQIVPGGTSTIAGWRINKNSLTKGTVGISSDDRSSSNIAFWAGAVESSKSSSPFRVDFAGNMTSTSGYIGGWRINSSSISAGSISLNADGSIDGPGWSISTGGEAHFNNIHVSGGTFHIGSNFNVSDDGTLTATNANISGTITATRGIIGGWTIGDLTISGGSTIMSANGSITNGNRWRLNADGSASFNNITITGGSFTIGNFSVTSAGILTATGGKIGGWNFDSNGFSKDSMHLYSNGQINCYSVVATQNATINNTCYSSAFYILHYHGQGNTNIESIFAHQGTYRGSIDVDSGTCEISIS